MSTSSDTTNVTSLRSKGPFEAARLALIEKLETLSAPRGISTFPAPSEFSTVAEHVRQATRIFDEWLSAIGHEVADNSPCHVDHKLFLSAYTDAIDGNALYECERASESLIEDYREVMGSR